MSARAHLRPGAGAGISIEDDMYQYGSRFHTNVRVGRVQPVAELRVAIAGMPGQPTEAQWLKLDDSNGHAVPFVRQLIREGAYRQAVYQDVVDRLQKVIAERAEPYQDPSIPGGSVLSNAR